MHKMLLDNIAHFVQQRSRLCFGEHKRPILQQRLQERLAHLNMPDLATYWGYLRNSAQEEPILLDLLTINETSFFRNPCQFSFLRERIVPQIEARRSEEVVRSWGRIDSKSPGSIMNIRVLCAGCSTGEEPYSVAMALFDALKYPRAWKIEIMAGDLSESCINTAAAGYYERERLKGIPTPYAGRYMEKHGKGAIVKDEIKRLVRFCRLNLNDIMNGEPFPGTKSGNERFDIIFCRNVMIYFSTEAQQQLVDTLFRLLSPGGYLFTGDAEPLHLYDHQFETVRDAGCLIYRKSETVENAEAIFRLAR